MVRTEYNQALSRDKAKLNLMLFGLADIVVVSIVALVYTRDHAIRYAVAFLAGLGGAAVILT